MSMLMVFVTFPNLEKAREVGTRLVDEQLAACVNLLPAAESIYRWQDKVESSGKYDTPVNRESAAEVLAIFKTTAAAISTFETRLQALHPYEVPEIVAIKPEQALAAYAAWVSDSVRESPPAPRA